MYLAAISSLLSLHLHQYADDSQIYVGVALRDAAHAVMWLGSNRQLSQITISVIPLQSAIVRVSESARDLGIVLNCKLTMSEHVSALCRSGFYHLRQPDR